MVLHQLGSACNFSGSCHVVSAKSYQVHCIMIFGNWDELGICSIGSVPCRFALAVPYSNLRYWHKTGKIMGNTFVVSQNFPHVFQCFFQMFKVSHVFHHLFPSFSPFLSSMFSHFSPMKFTIPGEAKPWWNFPSSEMVSRLRFRLHDKISWMLRAPKGSERPEICDVAHSESLDMIGHLRCEWIRFRLFDMNRHSESIWHHWNKIYIYIYNSKFGPAKRKNEKCKRKNTTTTRITNAKYLEKKEINTRCLSQNSWNITAKKKQTNFPLESSEILDFDAHVF